MKIIIAPDAFKGSLTANEAARAMEAGVRKVWPAAETIVRPVADGGEGTMETLVEATGGRFEEAVIHDPLRRPIRARYGILGDGQTAVVELAEASGLTLLSEEERNPLETTTFGTGELIRRALDQGFRKFLVCLGGSATNDGGTGLLEALGLRLYDADGKLLQANGAALERMARLDVAKLDPRLAGCEFQIASDVQNPLIGEAGASAVFGPQKGANADMVRRLDRGLHQLADHIERTTGIALHHVPGAGAAGGTAGALIGFCHAKLASGIDLVLEKIGFEAQLKNADLVLTGEGKTDRQTLDGKALLGVARLAKRHRVPVVVISGGVERDDRQELTQWFPELHSLADGGRSLDELMKNADRLLAERTADIIKKRIWRG